MLGLDPSISLSPHVGGTLTDSFLFAATDARVEPEHDVRGEMTAQMRALGAVMYGVEYVEGSVGL